MVEAGHVLAASEPNRRFSYRGIDQATGRRVAGEMAGDRPYDVRSALRRSGVIATDVIACDAQRVPPWLQPMLDLWHQRQRQNRRQTKADLCDALSTMMQAGITLDQALNSLATSPARSTQERALANRLCDGIRQGRSLHQLCREEPGWFDHFDVALLAAGEMAGDLHDTLVAVATHNQRAGSLSQRLFMALFYPALLLVAGIGVLAFMSHQVLPQLVAMLAQGKQQPPGLTLAIMHLGQGMVSWWYVVLPAVIGMGMLLKRAFTAINPDSATGRALHSNFLAQVMRRYRAARLAWSLSRLCRAGLPLLEAIAVTADSQDDRQLRSSLMEAAQVVARGGDFSASIGESRLLDPEFARLLSVGEQSGELVAMLERIAERFYRAADQTTDRLVAILNPAAIIVLAGLIGILVLACALPLAQLGDIV
jgi:type II secretory pathway component PulF